MVIRKWERFMAEYVFPECCRFTPPYQLPKLKWDCALKPKKVYRKSAFTMPCTLFELKSAAVMYILLKYNFNWLLIWWKNCQVMMNFFLYREIVYFNHIFFPSIILQAPWAIQEYIFFHWCYQTFLMPKRYSFKNSHSYFCSVLTLKSVSLFEWCLRKYILTLLSLKENG